MFENFGLLSVTLKKEGIRFILYMATCIGPVFGVYYGDGHHFISYLFSIMIYYL